MLLQLGECVSDAAAIVFLVLLLKEFSLISTQSINK